jgi:hypothetical protein
MNHAKAHQVCLAHLLRDARYAIEAGDKLFAPGFKFLLKRAFAIGRGSLADSTLLAYRRDLERRLSHLLTIEPAAAAGRKLRRGIEKCQDKLFVFVTLRDVPPICSRTSQRTLTDISSAINHPGQIIGRSSVSLFGRRRSQFSELPQYPIS